MSEEIKAIANATEEIAKTAGKSVDAISQFGGFISEFTQAPLEAGMGIIADKLNYMRWERQQRFLVRSRTFLKQIGLTAPSRPVPLNFAVPLLQAASLEDDDTLQDLWAALLVNAANARCGVDRRRAYISMLEQLTVLDALLLSKIYSRLDDGSDELALVTCFLPDEVRYLRPGEESKQFPAPTDDVLLSLANLVRIGCIDTEEDWSGKKGYLFAYQNMLGRAFVRSVTLSRD